MWRETRLELPKGSTIFQIPRCRNEKASQHWFGLVGVIKWKAEPILILLAMRTYCGRKNCLVTTQLKCCLTPWCSTCDTLHTVQWIGTSKSASVTNHSCWTTRSYSILILVYTENFSKNNSGGLAQIKLEAKCVAYHANEQNPEHCFVRLFKDRLPQTITDSSPFYLHVKNPKGITCSRWSWRGLNIVAV